VCVTAESAAKVNGTFSISGDQALNGRCMHDLPALSRKCDDQGGEGFWCRTLDTYCDVIAKRDAEEDRAEADRKKQAMAQQNMYLQQLQNMPAPMDGDMGMYFAQSDAVTSAALNNIFQNMIPTIPELPDNTCANRRRTRSSVSKTTPAISLPSPTQEDLKPSKKKVRSNSGAAPAPMPSYPSTGYDQPMYMPSAPEMTAPHHVGTGNIGLCNSCRRHQEEACERYRSPLYNDPSTLNPSLLTSFAQGCHQDCSVVCDGL
jgi:hypothetical protein